MEYKTKTVHAGDGWVTIPLDTSLASGQQLTVIPLSAKNIRYDNHEVYLDGFGQKDIEIKRWADDPAKCLATHNAQNDWIEGCYVGPGSGTFDGALCEVPFGEDRIVKQAVMSFSVYQTRNVNGGQCIRDENIDIIICENAESTIDNDSVDTGLYNQIHPSLHFTVLSPTNNADDGGYARITRIEIDTQPVRILSGEAPDTLVARIGGGTPFAINRGFDDQISASGSLEIAINGCFDGTMEVLVITDAPDVCDNNGTCGDGGNYKEKASANPIELRTATKVMSATDLMVNSPSGQLAFTRSYRQDRLTDGDYQFMGLGWSHNHRYTLAFAGTSPTRVVTVNLPDGGVLTLDEDPLMSGHFDARAGSNSVLDYDGTNNHYILTTQSKTTFVFADTTPYNLAQRTFPNGEVLNFSYDGSNNLTDVDDAYGRSLNFSYYSGLSSPDDFKNGQLWRVGDHTASGLGTGSPSGRFIELDYVPEKSNGTIIGSPKALLSSVTDVRGETWTYDYYGQDSGESATDKLNFFLQRLSPSVDTDGDGSADGALTLEDLDYTTNGSGTITQIDQSRGAGLIDTAFRFQPNGDNVTEEETAGKIALHHFANGVYVGQGDAEGNVPWQALGDVYRPEGVGDANGNATELTWANDGQQLTNVKDALGRDTSFAYNADDTLKQSTDAEGRKTNYLYNPGLRQPTMILVSEDSVADAEIDINGDMEDNSGWSAVSTVTHNQSTTEVDTGDNAWYVDASVANAGIESASWTPVVDRTYIIMARVFPVNSGDQVKMTTSSSDFSAISTSDGAWETLRAVFTASTTTARKLQFLADGAAAEFYVDSVHLVEVTDLLRWQGFIYDDKGRTLSEASINVTNGATTRQTTRVYGTSGNSNGLLESVTQIDVEDSGNNTSTVYTYDSAGRVVKQQKTSMFGTCEFSYTVYDAAGNVLATVCGLQDTTAPTSIPQAEAMYDVGDSVKKHTRITTHEYDEIGRRVKTTANAGMTTEQTSVTLYDALGRVIRTISNYVVQGSSAPGDWVWASTEWQDGSSNAISFGTENNQNTISDMDYNARGMVRLQRNPLGNVTLFGYNDAGRLVKTVQNASQPTYNNDYVGTSPDPDLSAYVAGSNVEEDIITEQVYDPAGNLVLSIDPAGRKSFTVYDELNRPVKTVRNAKDDATIALNDGDIGYDDANDPRSDNYVVSLDPDRDMINITEYDAMGRVVITQQLLENREVSEVWNTAYFIYDAQGRQVRIIRNYVAQGASNPEDWVWVSNEWQDGASNAIDHGSNNDQNLITETTYDVQGRVLYPFDINRNRNYMVYDGLGRQVLTVGNYQEQLDDNDEPVLPDTWNWDSNDDRWEYDAGDPVSHNNDDENILSQTHYDPDGRVHWTRDVLGRVNYMVYDEQGRNIMTVRNYTNPVDEGASTYTYTDPDFKEVVGMTLVFKPWYWDGTNWKDRSEPDQVIYDGDANDQNQITQTGYDDLGRVLWTRDTRGNVTYTVYDSTSRRVMTIANYVPQGTSNPEDWEWDSVTDNRWEDGAGNAISFGTNFDQNRISFTVYDRVGRVDYARDSAGLVMKPEYDALGRQVKTIQNYVDGTYSTSATDEDLISQTVYDQAGQVVKTIDARGTETTFSYDDAGRRVIVTQAANSPQAVSSYTCYDKAGRVLRTIQNYVPLFDANGDPILPDTWTGSAWDFNPTKHGVYNDQNRITSFSYDHASRRVNVTDPLGNQTTTSYFKDGQVKSMTDPEGTVTQYRYDELRRRNLVVQGFVDNGEDPASWVWSAGNSQYEESDTTAIVHGMNNDQNIIVQVAYDLVGRMTSLRNPRGYLTTYTYDLLNRRTSLTNPLSQSWQTDYANLGTGGSRQTMTYPGVNGAGSYDVVRDFDPLGRVASINFNDPTSTPDVDFGYDLFGNRASMTEYDNVAHTSITRETTFSYDNARRLTSVGFDTDGDTSIDETVSYEYDAGGLRTKMTLPGSLVIEYVYDQRGQLKSLTDWDSQKTTYAYDQAGRHIATVRPNDYRSRYSYDVASRLKRLRHTQGGKTFGDFIYAVDKRGNRTSALEVLPHPTGTTTTVAFDHTGISLTGSWTDHAGYKQSVTIGSTLKFLFFGDDNVDLTMGEGSDHGRYDVYIGNSLWRSFDGYAASDGDKVIPIPLKGEGPHLLEIRVRSDRNKNSSDHEVRFKQLVVDGEYDLHTVEYAYDKLSRVLSADYYNGISDGYNPFREYAFAYDRAGNRTSASLALNGGTPTVTSYSYNEGNQLTSDGAITYTYDANGNLWKSNGVVTNTWDRANRMLTAPGSTSYAYDGLGNRIQQSVSSVVTDYLLDLQPGLTKVIAETTGMNTQRYIHDPRGIFSLEDSVGDWSYMLNDGLGSVRAEVASAGALSAEQHYAPFGEPFAANGSFDGSFGFTGEQTNDTGQVYLRARHYNPSTGVFPSLDPFEGLMQRPMSLNGYSWVEGAVINKNDPSGKCWMNTASTPDQRHTCHDAFTQYTNLIYELYPDWPLHIHNLVGEEVRFWSALSYSEFSTLWNSNTLRPPSGTSTLSGTGDDMLATGAGLLLLDGPAQVSDIPGWIYIVGGLCLSALAAVGAGVISLPERWFHFFSDVNQRERDIPIPLDLPRDNRRRSRFDIALGLSEDFGGYPILGQFTVNLNALLNPSDIYVYSAFPQLEIVQNQLYDVPNWYEAGITSESGVGLDVFHQAFNDAMLFILLNNGYIHFNLESILDFNNSYDDFINLSPGSFSDILSSLQANPNLGGLVTATELLMIKNDPRLCQRTFFYESGSLFPPVASLDASIEICGSTPTIPLP